MAHSSERNIARTRFKIEDLQKRVSVLEATREDLERQIRKLNESVPEDKVDTNAHKEGWMRSIVLSGLRRDAWRIRLKKPSRAALAKVLYPFI